MSLDLVGDKRKLFISATAANYFGLPPSASLDALWASPELANFLDDGNEFLLSVVRSQDQLVVSKKVTAAGRLERVSASAHARGNPLPFRFQCGFCGLNLQNAVAKRIGSGLMRVPAGTVAPLESSSRGRRAGRSEAGTLASWQKAG